MGLAEVLLRLRPKTSIVLVLRQLCAHNVRDSVRCDCSHAALAAAENTPLLQNFPTLFLITLACNARPAAAGWQPYRCGRAEIPAAWTTLNRLHMLPLLGAEHAMCPTWGRQGGERGQRAGLAGTATACSASSGRKLQTAEQPQGAAHCCCPLQNVLWLLLAVSVAAASQSNAAMRNEHRCSRCHCRCWDCCSPDNSFLLLLSMLQLLLLQVMPAADAWGECEGQGSMMLTGMHPTCCQLIVPPACRVLQGLPACQAACAAQQAPSAKGTCLAGELAELLKAVMQSACSPLCWLAFCRQPADAVSQRLLHSDSLEFQLAAIALPACLAAMSLGGWTCSEAAEVVVGTSDILRWQALNHL